MNPFIVAALLIFAGASVLPGTEASQIVNGSHCQELVQDACDFTCDLLRDIPFNAIAGVIKCLP